MSKINLKIFDKQFSHAEFCSYNNQSKYITWDRSENINENDIVIFTDSCLDKINEFNNKNFTKIGWLLEPPAIISHSYDYIIKNHNKFDYVFTHQDFLLSLSNKFKLVPPWCTWIKPENQKIFEKEKNLSIIASNKKDTYGQKLRHQMIERLNNKTDLDIFGTGYNFIEEKSIGLSKYNFSFIIENSKSDYYFTEKIIDCFITGTIPIYWGAKKIDEFFNINGIIIIDSIDDIINKINEFDEKLYNKMKTYVIENFEIARQYLTIEDYIYLNYKNIITK